MFLGKDSTLFTHLFSTCFENVDLDIRVVFPIKPLQNSD